MNKKFDYKTFKFWDVVKEIDWSEACDMHHRNEDVNANDWLMQYIVIRQRNMVIGMYFLQ